MLAIYRREMGAFFTSGVAYVFLAVFWLVSGIFFYNGVIASGFADTSSMFSSMFYIVMFLIPVLTMKLLSEEKKNKTDQGLLTAPISLWDIVLGKYFAALNDKTARENGCEAISLVTRSGQQLKNAEQFKNRQQHGCRRC